VTVIEGPLPRPAGYRASAAFRSAVEQVSHVLDSSMAGLSPEALL
jgi:hypothetical protein